MKIKTLELKKRANQVFKLLENCEVCPRKCHVNRRRGERGYCQVLVRPVVSASYAHFGEEAPLSGTHGSGTIFFAHCNLACVFCQNWDISQLGRGKETSIQSLAEMMLELQGEGCHNINFVTPTPHIPQILKALTIAYEKGLKIPLVYNTNTYDRVEVLKLLDGIIDIYLPDVKYADPKIAERYSSVSDYPRVMKKALKEMQRQVGDLVMDEVGIATRGMLIRHLVLPGGLAGTQEIMEFIFRELSPNAFVNIMGQYRPCYKASEYPPLDRPVTVREVDEAKRIASEIGLPRIYS